MDEPRFTWWCVNGPWEKRFRECPVMNRMVVRWGGCSGRSHREIQVEEEMTEHIRECGECAAAFFEIRAGGFYREQ